MHPEIETTILTGYPTMDYIEYEKEDSCDAPLINPQYDDAETLFKTLEEEIK